MFVDSTQIFLCNIKYALLISENVIYLILVVMVNFHRFHCEIIF